MKNFNETQIKYLAGLLDADGSMSFVFTKENRCHLKISLQASESVDRKGRFIKSLAAYCGNVYNRKFEEENISDANAWYVQKRSELNRLLPRLIKHMVVKGGHWSRLYSKFTELLGKQLDGKQIAELKNWSKESRLNSGPLKPKKHPTWAWVAGYLDGDGYYKIKRKRGSSYQGQSIVVLLKPQDRCAIDLLLKAFNGYIYSNGEFLVWEHNLGVRDKAFAKSFLKKMVQHSQLKTWKIERMLEFLHSSRND